MNRMQGLEWMPFIKTHKQAQALNILNTTLHTLLWGGSRSGKTFIIIRNIIIRAAMKKSRHLIVRLRFNHVKKSIGMDTLPTVMAACFPHLKYEINKSEWFFHLPNGSEIWLAGMDTKERVENVLGREFSTIYFNECSQMVDYGGISTFLTRLAETSGLSLRAYYDANPPSKNHWLHRYFIEGVTVKGFPVQDWEQEYGNLQLNPKDNLANLSQQYFKIMEGMPRRHRERFLLGLFGSDVEGALWNDEMIDIAKGMLHNGNPLRTVVGVDPAVTSHSDSDEWGIIAGVKAFNGKATVLEDVSGIYTPSKAIDVVMSAYTRHEADAIIVEKNQGGDMIDLILRQKGYKGKIISVHASKGKFARAEPVQALYEQELIRHDPGLESLESEMMEWVPHETIKSPNRIDALVWCLWELFGLGTVEPRLRSL